MSTESSKRTAAVEALILSYAGDAVRAFATELQCRRPGTLDDEAANAAATQGLSAAHTAVRFAAAIGNADLLATVLVQVELFVAKVDIERWIEEVHNG